MTPTPPAIPDPPREVRWRTCLAHRWVLGLLGALFALQGGIVFAVMWATCVGGPFLGDFHLDSGASRTTGSILAVEPVDRRSVRIRYAFDPGTGRLEGASYATAPAALRSGDSCEIEFLRDAPGTSRAAGTQALYFDPDLSLLGQLLLVPGALGFLFWVRSVMRMRVALREGTEIEAQVIENRLRPLVNPTQVRLSYRFRDAADVEVIHAHWVRAGSEFGQWLTSEQPRFVSVVFDPDRPTLSRAVWHTDFGAGVRA